MAEGNANVGIPIYTMVTTDIYLANLTWSASSSGGYYANLGNFGLTNRNILSAQLSEWSLIDGTKNLMIYVRSEVNEIGLLSSVNSFNSDGRIKLKIIYS